MSNMKEWVIECYVCHKKLEEVYCTENVCETCCKQGKCKCDSWCINKKIERMGNISDNIGE